MGSLKNSYLTIKFIKIICPKCKQKIAINIQKVGTQKTIDNMVNIVCEDCLKKIKLLVAKHSKDLKGMVTK